MERNRDDKGLVLVTLVIYDLCYSKSSEEMDIEKAPLPSREESAK